MSYRVERVGVDGVEYLFPDALSVGDYGGYGAIGHANLKVIEDMAEAEGWDWGYPDGGVHYRYAEMPGDDPWPEIIEFSGAYSSRWLGLRADVPELVDIADSLDNYPVLDESEWSEIQHEWEEAAYDDWACGDFLHELAKLAENDSESAEEPDNDAQAAFDALDALELDRVWPLFHKAMEISNLYWETDESGAYIDVLRMARALVDSLDWSDIIALID